MVSLGWRGTHRAASRRAHGAQAWLGRQRALSAPPTAFAGLLLASPPDAVSRPADTTPLVVVFLVLVHVVSEANFLNSLISKPMSRVILTAIIIVKAL